MKIYKEVKAEEATHYAQEYEAPEREIPVKEILLSDLLPSDQEADKAARKDALYGRRVNITKRNTFMRGVNWLKQHLNDKG